MGQKIKRRHRGHVSCRLQKVLPTLHHQRHAMAIGQAMAPMLDERCARAQTAGHHQVHRRATHRKCHIGIARVGRVHPKRLHVLAGGVDVQNVIGCSHHRTQNAGAPQFGAIANSIEFARRPDAVEVMHQLAAFERAVLIERFIRRHVGKADGQRADKGAYPCVQQMCGRHHAADLVAMREGIDEHMGAGLARLEAVHIVDADIALAVRREVAGKDFKNGRVLGHGGEGVLHIIGSLARPYQLVRQHIIVSAKPNRCRAGCTISAGFIPPAPCPLPDFARWPM